MFVLVNEAVYAPGQWAAGQAQRTEYLALLAQQPGFRGLLTIDAGAERRLSLGCWDSAAQYEAAQPTTQPVSARLLAPLLATPRTPVGRGEVGHNTLTAGAAPTFARLSELTNVSDLSAAGQAQRDAYRALLAQQPGYQGGLIIDSGAGHQLVLLCWASQAQREAAAPVLQAPLARLVGPVYSAPPRILGEGAVVYDTLTANVASA